MGEIATGKKLELLNAKLHKRSQSKARNRNLKGQEELLAKRQPRFPKSRLLQGDVAEEEVPTKAVLGDDATVQEVEEDEAAVEQIVATSRQQRVGTTPMRALAEVSVLPEG